eukprot:CAMPEP_0119482468 /NCGR_PEP_ID=MMETSP1344-20130328/10305_1 /TAXON_ID=236787 /ORGANISM="Florenciella parvula, Strain CCMP2471" /LENGTH=142 /DNA_ID=CAMNT_0007516863 /DNA_START=155 /DNA_END=581 /DNA_ORIENTATION=+
MARAPAKVTLAGREGRWDDLMGPYELSAEPAHGYPLYSKRAAGGATHWLYRSSGTGRGNWLVGPDESCIAENDGCIVSTRAAALPTEAGLAWLYDDGADWHDDPKMSAPRLEALKTKDQADLLEIVWKIGIRQPQELADIEW